MPSQLMRKYFGADLSTRSGRAIVEEHYWSLRRQTPIVYLLALVNLSAMEIAAGGTLSAGLNVPTFIAACGLVRMWHWYGNGRAGVPSPRAYAQAAAPDRMVRGGGVHRGRARGACISCRPGMPLRTWR